MNHLTERQHRALRAMERHNIGSLYVVGRGYVWPQDIRDDATDSLGWDVLMTLARARFGGAPIKVSPTTPAHLACATD